MPPLPPPPAPVEIVVTGAGLAAPAGDAAYDVVTIGRDRLAATASGRLEDALRDVAGFQQFRRSDARSAHPTSQGATLRGLGGNASSRALVVLDGVPQVDPFGGWVSFAALDLQRLGEVRVTRGGGSGVFGPGALAGTIALDSAGPDALPPVTLTAAYGSRAAAEARGQVFLPAGAGFVGVAATHQRGDGFVPIVADRRGPADIRAAYRQSSLSTRALFPVGGEAELQAAMLLFRDERGRGLAFTGNAVTGADASIRLVGRGRWGFEALAYLQTRDFRSGFASTDPARTRATATLDQYSVPATGIGGRIELRPPLPYGIELRTGLDARLADGTTNEDYSYVDGRPTRSRAAGGRTTTAGLFADLSLPLDDRLVLTAGGRVDRWWIADGHLDERIIATGAPVTAAAFPDRDGTEATARGGIAWTPDRHWRVRSAAYLGWRLPTLNELYRPFRAGADATAANPALSPERLRGIDAGIDWTPLPNTKLSATLFDNRLDDAIGNVTLGRGPGTFPGVGFVAAGGVYRQRGNLDAVRARGGEFDAQVTNGEWRLAASYAFTDARVRASGAAAALDGLRPAQTPRQAASLTVGRTELSGLTALATLRYAARQYEDDQNARTLAGATTLDLVTRIPLGRGLSLEARAENVTNARVEATISGDGLIERAAPRALWLGLRLER